MIEHILHLKGLLLLRLPLIPLPRWSCHVPLWGWHVNIQLLSNCSTPWSCHVPLWGWHVNIQLLSNCSTPWSCHDPVWGWHVNIQLLSNCSIPWSCHDPLWGWHVNIQLLSNCSTPWSGHDPLWGWHVNIKLLSSFLSLGRKRFAEDGSFKGSNLHHDVCFQRKKGGCRGKVSTLGSHSAL